MKEDWKKQELKPNKSPILLSEEDIQGFLLEYPNWRLITTEDPKVKKLVREINFPNFIDAFSYLTKIAILSEKLDHHAEIWNTYSSVRITIFTHTSLNLTQLDRLFAFHSESMI